MSDQYRSLLEEADDLMVVVQGDKLEFVNCKQLAELGYSLEDVQGRSIFDFVHVDDRDRITEHRIKKTKSRISQDDLTFRILGKNNRLAFVKTTSIATRWQGEPATLVCIKNITSARVSELTLQNSEHLLLSVINNLSDPTFVIDLAGRVRVWNRAMEKLSAVKAKNIVGKKEFIKAVPFSGYKEPSLVDLMLAPDDVNEKDYEFFQKNEEILIVGRFLESPEDRGVHIWTTSSILFDANGDAIGAVESFRDMTEIRTTEEMVRAAIDEKNILLRELHHRVKSNMQLVKSLLNMQLQYVRDPEAVDLFRDSISRIETMGIIHHEFYGSQKSGAVDFGAFIPKLLGNLRMMYRPTDVLVSVEAAGVRLGIEEAIPCGLILNELISNCFKHAFPEKQRGSVLVTVAVADDGGSCRLAVQDDGVGLPPGFDFFNNLTSYGLMMVQILSTQLQGTVRIDPHGGTGFTVVFPLTPLGSRYGKQSAT